MLRTADGLVVAICSHARRGRPRSALPTERYQPRRPDKAPLHRIVAKHLETWLDARDRADQPVPGHVEEELRAYLRRGILGFARARCTACGTGFLIGFSCKGRGVCPSCNGRRMAQTAAHLVDRVIPPVPVRQRVISVPKRLRCFLADRPEAVTALAARPVFALERLSLLQARDGRPTRIRYVLPRHKRGTWVGPGRSRKSSAPDAHGVFAPNHPRSGGDWLVFRRNTSPAEGDRHLFLRNTSPAEGDRHLFLRNTSQSPSDTTHTGSPSGPIARGSPVIRMRAREKKGQAPTAVQPEPVPGAAFIQAHDDRDVVQPSPDGLPVIDIHAR